jgi:hypothetical protein
VLALVNEMLGSGAVTGPKILASSVGAANAIFQSAAIQNADIASLQVTKLTAGSLTVQMSVTAGGLIRAQSGSAIADMGPGYLSVRNATQEVFAQNGVLQVGLLSGGGECALTFNAFNGFNSSGQSELFLNWGSGGGVTIRAGASTRIAMSTTALALTSVSLTIGGITAIDASRNAFLQQVTLNERVTFGESEVNSTAPTWVRRVPVNIAGVGFAGYLKISSA